MSVKCLSPVRLYGELAGEYERGQPYPDARLAAEYPDYFAAWPDPAALAAAPVAPVPDPGTPAPESAAPVPDTGRQEPGSVPDAGTAEPAAEFPSKRKNRRHNP